MAEKRMRPHRLHRWYQEGAFHTMRCHLLSVLYAVCLLAPLAGCSSPPSPDPELKYELDALLRDLPKGDREYTGKIPFERMPLAVGHWAEYLVLDEAGEPSRVRIEIVGEEGSAFWIQQTKTTYYTRSSLKLLVADAGVGDRMELRIQRALHRDRKGNIVELPEIDPSIQEYLQHLVDTRVTGDVAVTVKVPAGTFENTVLQQLNPRLEGEEEPVPLQQWFHSEVPIWGVVKAVSLEDRRSQWELLGFGRTGAVDLFKKR
jgi:hypothetical protein